MKILKIATLAKAWTQIIGIPVAIVALLASAFAFWQTLSTACETMILSRLPALAEARKIFDGYEEITVAAVSYTRKIDRGEFLDPADLLKKSTASECGWIYWRKSRLDLGTRSLFWCSFGQPPW